MIDITFLGTAALVPIPDRALASVFLSVQGKSILFDCGEGTQTAARKWGVSLMKTDFIVLTHFHGDHIFGLPGLMQTMSVMGRTEKLNIIAPPGGHKELAPIFSLAGTVNYPVELIEADENPIKLQDFAPDFPKNVTLYPVKTNHRVVSRGYTLSLSRAGKFLPEKAKELNIPVNFWSVLQNGGIYENDGRIYTQNDVCTDKRAGLKVTITGDTAYCDTLEMASQNADLIISEATYGDNADEPLAIERGHMTFENAANLAKNANAKLLYLTHFSQKIKDPAEYLHIATNIFENTQVAYDGDKLTLTFPE